MADIRKKKKHHPVRNFFIVLTVILLAIALPIGALYWIIYDKTTNTRVYESKSITEVGNKALVKGIRNAPQNSEINVSISKDDFNGIIVDLTSSMNIEQIKKIYVLKQDGQANFFMELEAGPLKTLITLKTTVLSEGEDIQLSIDNILVGKLKVSKSFFNNILKTFKIQLPEPGQEGVKFDFTNWLITIDKNILLDSVNNGDGIVGDVFKIIQDNALLSFDGTRADSILSLDIDLSKLQNNQYLTQDEDHLFTNVPSSIYATMGIDQTVSVVDSKVSYLIQHADIKADQVQPLFNFFFKGFKSTSENDLAVVNQVKNANPNLFEEIGVLKIEDYRSYGDELMENSSNLLGNAEAQINFTDLSKQDVASISEKDLNNFIKGKGVIGYTGIVTYADSNNKVEDYAFFVIDNFYCNIVTDHIYFVCGLNVNGFSTNIVFAMEKDDSQPDKSRAYFRLVTVQYGEIDGESMKDTLFNIINDGLSGDTMVGADKEKGLIYFNLQPVVDKVKEFEDYKDKTASDIELNAIGDDLSANGQLKLSIH